MDKICKWALGLGMHKGKFTITSPCNSDGRRYISITIIETLSLTEFISVELDHAAFAEALTGLSRQDCEFELRPDCVGMQRETKVEILNVTKLGYKRDSKEDAEFLKPYEVDGWKGRADDLHNGHNGPEKARKVNFKRHIKPIS